VAARLTMNTPISDLLSNQGRLALGAQRAGDRHHILLPLTGGELLQQELYGGPANKVTSAREER
jgi:hypothetical protein